MKRARTCLVAFFALTLASASAPTASASVPECFGRPATIVGTPRNDRLAGTDRADVMWAGSGVDTVYGRGGNDLICGAEDHDRLYGGPGDDKLNGGHFWDSLWGGPGDDRLDGGPGPGTHGFGGPPSAYDDARFTLASRGVTANLATGRATGEGHDTLVRVDQLFGSDHDDVLVGNALSNYLVGLGGNDRLSSGAGHFELLIGGRGNDSLEGGPGIYDHLDGGRGDDALDGGRGAPSAECGCDTADYSDLIGSSAWGGGGAPGPIHLDLAAGEASGDGNDTLTGIERVYGSEFDDSLLGDAGINVFWGLGGADQLDGRDGVDFLVPGDGNDTAEGGGGKDWAHYYIDIGTASDPAPVHVDLEAGQMTSPGSLGTDALTGIENAEGTDRFDDTVWGDAGPNVLRGFDSDDILGGRAGDDYLDGGFEKDTLKGGPGDDTCVNGEIVTGCGPLSAAGAERTWRRMIERARLSEALGQLEARWIWVVRSDR